MLAARIPSGLQTMKAVKARDGGAVLRTCQFVKVRDATNVLRTVWSAFSAAVSRTDCQGFGDSTGAITITTQNTTASGVGGTGPFAFAWSQTGGDAAVISHPTAATTAFSLTGVGPGDSKIGTFQCIVTDAATGATAPVGVTATATNVSTA